MITIRDKVLVDIDHVISNAFWRDGMMPPHHTWDEYHAANKDDEPVYDIVRMLQSLTQKDEHGACFFRVIGFTARPGKWRKQTMEWCVKYGVPLDELLMRPDDDFTPAAELKVKLATERFAPHDLKLVVAFVLDDREDVCAAFKALGVTAMQVMARRE